MISADRQVGIKIAGVVGVVFVASAAFASAFTATSSNLISGDPTETPIVDITGTPIALGSGVTAVGYFPSLSNAEIIVLGNSADFQSILGDFSLFGSERSGFSNAFGAPGFFTHYTDAPIPNGGDSPFEGEFLYTVIGDGPTLADSLSFAIWVGNSVFEEEDEFGIGTANTNVTPGEGTLLVGCYGGPVDLGVAQFPNSIELNSFFCPEPSLSALLGLAGLGFVARRKR